MHREYPLQMNKIHSGKENFPICYRLEYQTKLPSTYAVQEMLLLNCSVETYHFLRPFISAIMTYKRIKTSICLMSLTF